MTSLLEKYGGFASVRRIVSDFYDAVLDDTMIAHHFAAVDLRRLVDHQTKMVSAFMGGPAFLSDTELTRAHQRLAITHGEFDRLRDLLDLALSEHGVGDEDAETVVAQLESKRALVVSA